MMIEKIIDTYGFKTFEKGRRYFEEGRVIYAVKCGDRLLGEVMGNDRYYVEVNLTDLRAICSCPVRYDCKHAVALILAHINGYFSEDSSRIAEAYPLLVVSDVKDVIKKLLKYPCERNVLDVVRLLRFRKDNFDKEFLIELLEGVDAGEFYNDYYDYYFYDQLVETVVEILIEKGLDDKDLKRLKKIAEKDFIGDDVAWYLAHYYDEFFESLDSELVFQILMKRDKKKAYEFAKRERLCSELIVYFDDFSFVDFTNLSYEACVKLLKKGYELRKLFDYCYKVGFYDLCVEIAIKLNDLSMMKRLCRLDDRVKVFLLSRVKRRELIPEIVKTVFDLVSKGRRSEYKKAVKILKNLKMIDERAWNETIQSLRENHPNKYALWEEIEEEFGS